MTNKKVIVIEEPWYLTPYINQVMAIPDVQLTDGIRTPKHLRKWKSKPFSEKTPKVDRNSPCPCGCGKKAKKCSK